jgi:amino acid permease
MFTIHNELFDNSQQRKNSIVLTAIGSAAAVYEIIGIIGYLNFGDDVRSNIIAMCRYCWFNNTACQAIFTQSTLIDKTSAFVTVGRAAIVILVLFSYPLQAHPCRACLDKIVKRCFRRDERMVAPENDLHRSNDSAQRKLLNELFALEPPSDLAYVSMTSVILITSYLIAILVSELDVVSQGYLFWPDWIRGEF